LQTSQIKRFLLKSGFDLLQRLKATKHFSPFALQLSELHPSLQLAFE
jgi:hypothetical protein